jgi:hypothetical protein
MEREPFPSERKDVIVTAMSLRIEATLIDRPIRERDYDKTLLRYPTAGPNSEAARPS